MTTLSFWMDCRHLNFCTNDFHYFLNGLSSSKWLYEWLPSLCDWIIVMHIAVRMTTISFWVDYRHAQSCTNDYELFLNRFSSCTFLYEWLPFRFEWIFVMHILCNDFPYFLYFGFRHAYSVQMTFHILCKWIFVKPISVQMTFHILLVFYYVCNALLRVNSMVQWRIINDITMYIGFWQCA